MVAETGGDNGFAGIATLEGLTWYYGHSIGEKWGDLDADLDLDVVVTGPASSRTSQPSAVSCTRRPTRTRRSSTSRTTEIWTCS
jgi:hypothetical protein